MSPSEYWGRLISAENPTQPTPLFTSLLLAIADYTIEELEPKSDRRLTPAKLSSFYKAVGGDLDELFIHTPPDKLSSIYTTLGCAHSLEPVPDDYFVPPCIPALTSHGFTVWQTVQLLLDPQEHVPYLQEAVRKLPLRETRTGNWFPKELPASAFPPEPDRETVRWHDDMFARKRALEERQAAAAARDGVVNMQAAGGGAALGAEDDVDDGYSKYQPWGGGYRRKRHSRHKERKSKPVEPDILEAHSRSAPGTGSESYGVPRASHHRHHHSHGGYGHRHRAKGETPYSSDEEVYDSPRYSSQSRGHSRHHSYNKGPENPKGYIYANGSSVPMYPNERPDLQHFQSHPNLHSFQSPPPISPSFEDLRESFHRHRQSSSPLAGSPPLRPAPLGPTSAAYYYDELGTAPAEYDGSDEELTSGGWAMHEGRSREILRDDYERAQEQLRHRGVSHEEAELDRRQRRAIRESKAFQETLQTQRSWGSIPSTHGSSRVSSAGPRYKSLGGRARTVYYV